jgi:hypothetical protein
MTSDKSNFVHIPDNINEAIKDWPDKAIYDPIEGKNGYEDLAR